MASNHSFFPWGRKRSPSPCTSSSNYSQLNNTNNLSNSSGNLLEPSCSQMLPESEDSRERMRRNLPTAWYMMRPLLSEKFQDGSVKYNILKYSDEALKVMNQFRQEGALCDVVLHAKGEELPAHKIVLAACSLYFRAMFTHGMRESTSEHIHLHECIPDPQTLRSLVDFAYTHEIKVNQDNVQSLLVSSMYLQMNHVIEACTQFMEEQLEPGNCVGFAHFASANGCLDLESKARRFIEEQFCEVIRHDEYLTMTSEEIMGILTKDELNIKCETEVFKAVVKWVEYNPEARKSTLEYLLDKVRMSSLAPYFLEEQLERCTLIKQLPCCKQQLIEKLKKLTEHRPCGDEPRKPCKTHVIYTVGGFYRKVMDSLSCFECYNAVSKAWTRLPALPSPTCGPGVTSLCGKIYVVGGRMMRCGQNVDSCATVVYDPSSNQWSSTSHMTTARNRVAVSVLDGRIYAVGGSAGGEMLKSAERLNPHTESWERIADMKNVRMSHGVAVFHRLVYAVGGFDGRHRLRSVECYYPETNEWVDKPPLIEARSGAGVAVLKGCIYAVGGYDGQNQLTSVEKYDPQTETWEMVAPLTKARSGVGVAVMDDKLYALGGFDGTDFLSCVEKYDPFSNTWEAESSMLCARSGHGVAVEREPCIS